MCILGVYDKKDDVCTCKQKMQVFMPELWQFTCLIFGRVYKQTLCAPVSGKAHYRKKVSANLLKILYRMK